MVDLGPVGPMEGWSLRSMQTVVEGLELWHAAWERDHPDLLGFAGPSFYRPELDTLLAPWVLLASDGITVAQAGHALRTAFGPQP